VFVEHQRFFSDLYACLPLLNLVGAPGAVIGFCVGVSLDQAKRSSGIDLIAGAAPMPREMSFPLGAAENWSDVYDYIRWMMISLAAVVNHTGS